MNLLKDVAAVIPTRGDVDLTEIIFSLPMDEVVVWDNSVDGDVSVYGRYSAIENTQRPVIFTQDDDCLFPADAWSALLEAYEPGKIVANMPVSRWDDYPDSALLGWGSLFDRGLPQRAFTRYIDAQYGTLGPTFLRTCDVIFSTLTPHRKIDLGFTHLPWAETPGRMFKQPGHKAERDKVLAVARLARDRP